MEHWDLRQLEVAPHHPEVLSSHDEGRSVVLQLPAGERLQDHEVHERAFLVVIDGEIEISQAGDGSLTGGPGLLVLFEPQERREILATRDALLLFVFAPWPGEGHPRNA